MNLGSAVGSIELRSDGVTRGVNAAIAAIKKLEAQTAGSSKNLDQLAASGGKIGTGIATGAQGATKSLQQLAQSGAQVGVGVTKGVAQAETSLRNLGSSADQVFAGLNKIGNASALAGGGIAAGIGAAVKVAADFEAQLSAVKAVTQATDGDMARLRATALALGQDVTLSGVSASGAAQAMEALGKAGISVSDQIGGATKGALLLASAGALDFGQAAEIAANAMTTFGLKGGDVAHIADLFASAANASTIDVADLAQSMNQAGLVSAQFGHSIEETTGVLTAFGAAGLKSSDAGTSLKQLMISLVNPSQQAADVIKQYGLNFFDAQGRMISFAGIAEQLKTHLAGLSDEQRNAALATIFGSDAIRGALILYNQGATGINKYTNAIDQQGAAARVGAERNKNLEGSLNQLKDSAETFGIALGTKAIPALTTFVGKATDLVNAFNDLSDGQQNAILYTATGAAGFLLLTASVTKTLTTLRDLKGAVDDVVGAFGRKEAAKRSLIDANKDLAESAGNTGKSFKALPGAAAPAAAAIADVAVVTAAAGAGIIAIIEGGNKLHDQFGENSNTIDEFNARQQALNLAMAHGATYENGAVDGFMRLAEAQGATVSSLDDLVPLWNQYVDGVTKAGVGADGLTHASLGMLGPMDQLNSQLGEGKLAGAEFNNTLVGLGVGAKAYASSVAEAVKQQQALADAQYAKTTTNAARMGLSQAGYQEFDIQGSSATQAMNDQASAAIALQGRLDALATQEQGYQAALQATTSAAQPLQAAYDLLNQKVAAGIPLTSEQAALYASLPGYLAQATAGTDDLIASAAETQIAIQNASASAPAAGSNFVGMSGQAAQLSSQLDQLRVSAIALDGALGALGTENSKLGAEYDILGQRIDVLNAKKKESGGLSADEAAELATLTTAQQKLGDQMGTNAAQQRALVLASVDNTATTQTQTAAVNELNSTLSNTGAASGEANAALVGINDGMGNVVTSAGTAAGAVNDVGTAVGQIPPSANVDITVTPPPGGANAIPAAAGAGPDGTVTVPVKVEMPPNPLVGLNAGLDQSGVGDTGVTIPVHADTTQAKLDIDNMATDTPTVKVPVELDTSGLGSGLGGGAGAIASVAAQNVIKIPVQVDDTQARIDIDNMTTQLGDLGTTIATPQITITDQATPTITQVAGAVSTLGTATATPTATLNDQASGGLATIQGQVDSLNGASFTITAHVDISGALANIEALNNNIPHSPAKEGPFRELPTWKAVWAGLETSGAAAITTLQDTTLGLKAALTTGIDDATAAAAKSAADLANTVAGAVAASNAALTGLRTFRAPNPAQFVRLHDALAPILASFAADGATQTEEGMKATSAYADNVSKIVAAVGAGADALGKLRDFQRPTDEALRAFRDSSQYLVNLILQVATDTDTGWTEAGATYAEAAQKVYASVGAGVDALVKLQGFHRPADKALTDFRDASQYVMNLLAQVARDAELDAVADAGTYAESASKVYQSVSSGVDALVKLSDFTRPTDKAVTDFRDVSQFLVNVIAQVAADGEGPAFQGAAAWAEAATKIFAAVSSGVESLTKLGGFARPTDQAVNSFRDVAQYVVNVIAQVAADSDQGAVAAAAQWADNAGKILAILKTGADGFAALGDFRRPTDAALRDFTASTAAITAMVATVAADMDADTLAQASAYADTAGKVVGLVGNGAKTLSDFAQNDFAAPDAGKLRTFADATLAAVQAIGAAASSISTQGLASAATYADGAGKVVSLVGNGVKGFADLATFVAPSAGQIQNFKSAVSATVIAIAQAATEIDQDAVKAAGTYSEGAGKAVSLLGSAVSAFNSMKTDDGKPIVPSKEAIDQVVSATNYGVQQLVGIAGSYGPAQLAQLTTFADAAGKGWSALGGALDAGKALSADGRIKPADAVGEALSEFQAGLGPLGQLLTLSETYRTQGLQIGSNLAQAYNAIAGALPGYDVGRAAASAASISGTVTGQQTVVHRIEGAVDFRFLGDNGEWIVSSLQADDPALTATANLIGGKFKDVLLSIQGAA